ncbi:MAG TPA: outer membrane lipoprotein carrier protein LolA [Gemmatimonadales bacterium]
MADTRRRRAVATSLTVAALAVTGRVATAQDTMAALTRAQGAYEAISSLRANFRQTISNPMLGDPEITHGVLFLLKPDRFAMRFAEPAGDRVVADGEWLWAYTPSTVPNQVIKQPIPSTGTATPNIFAQFVDRPLDRYEATYGGPETIDGDPVDVVRLIPLQGELGFRQATIAISTRTGLLRRLALVEDSGQRRTIVLHDIEPGAAIPRAEVTFVVPRGAKVVTP